MLYLWIGSEPIYQYSHWGSSWSRVRIKPPCQPVVTSNQLTLPLSCTYYGYTHGLMIDRSGQTLNAVRPFTYA